MSGIGDIRFAENYYNELYKLMNTEDNNTKVLRIVQQYRQPQQETPTEGEDNSKKQKPKQPQVTLRQYDPNTNDYIVSQSIKLICLYKLLTELGSIQKSTRYVDPASNGDKFKKTTTMVSLLSDYINSVSNNLKYLLYEDFDTKKAHNEMFKLLNKIESIGMISTSKTTYTIVEVCQE